MAGIPGIYSSISTYSDDVRHKVTGLLANDTESWYASLRHLIESEELRRYIAKNARDDVLAKYNIEDRIGLWESAYESFASLTPNVEAAPWQTQSASQHQGRVKTDPVLATA